MTVTDIHSYVVVAVHHINNVVYNCIHSLWSDSLTAGHTRVVISNLYMSYSGGASAIKQFRLYTIFAVFTTGIILYALVVLIDIFYEMRKF